MIFSAGVREGGVGGWKPRNTTVRTEGLPDGVRVASWKKREMGVGSVWRRVWRGLSQGGAGESMGVDGGDERVKVA